VESETLCPECERCNRARYGNDHSETIDSINLLANLYDAWHAAEPDQGYDAKAAESLACKPALQRTACL